MLPFKRGAFHLAVQAQVIATSPSAAQPQSPTVLSSLAEACHGVSEESHGLIALPLPQVPIVPIVMSSYQDFYCKKERRFTSGESSEQNSGGEGPERSWQMLRDVPTRQDRSVRAVRCPQDHLPRSMY